MSSREIHRKSVSEPVQRHGGGHVHRGKSGVGGASRKTPRPGLVTARQAAGQNARASARTEYGIGGPAEECHRFFVRWTTTGADAVNGDVAAPASAVVG